MSNFGVIQDGVVINMIVCDSKELAEELTGATCVEYFDENPAWVGAEYNSDTNMFSEFVPEVTGDFVPGFPSDEPVTE